MTLEALNAMDQAAFTDAVGWIFEHSRWVAERAWAVRPFEAALERAETPDRVLSPRFTLAGSESIAEVRNAMDQAAFTDAVGWIFEYSPWVADRAWAVRPFEAVLERAESPARILSARFTLAGSESIAEVRVAGEEVRDDG
jgi:2-oxo-4-hydroxy-4-carboxy--5-ureidoimidazoline (OHCU) decarboxylase